MMMMIMLILILSVLCLLLLTIIMMNNDDDNDVDYDNHPDSMIVIVDDGVNAFGGYNDVDNHGDDDPYTI